MSKTLIILLCICYKEVISAPIDSVNPANPGQVEARSGTGFGISYTNGGKTLAYGTGKGSAGGGGGAGPWGAVGSGGTKDFAPQIRIPPGQQWSGNEEGAEGVSEGEGGEEPVEGGAEGPVEGGAERPVEGGAEGPIEGGRGTNEGERPVSEGAETKPESNVVERSTDSSASAGEKESSVNKENAEKEENTGNTEKAGSAAESAGNNNPGTVNSAFGFGPDGGGGVVLNNRGSSGL